MASSAKQRPSPSRLLWTMAGVLGGAFLIVNGYKLLASPSIVPAAGAVLERAREECVNEHGELVRSANGIYENSLSQSFEEQTLLLLDLARKLDAADIPYLETKGLHVPEQIQAIVRGVQMADSMTREQKQSELAAMWTRVGKVLDEIHAAERRSEGLFGAFVTRDEAFRGGADIAAVSNQNVKEALIRLRDLLPPEGLAAEDQTGHDAAIDAAEALCRASRSASIHLVLAKETGDHQQLRSELHQLLEQGVVLVERLVRDPAIAAARRDSGPDDGCDQYQQVRVTLERYIGSMQARRDALGGTPL